MTLLFLAALAHAAAPAEVLWSAPPDARLADLQRELLVPAPPERGPDVPGLHQGPLLYGLQGGGKVTLYLAPGSSQASDIFDGLVRTAAQYWPPSDWPATSVPIVAERAQGDGEGIALVQFDNVVILVRDPRGQAASVVEQVRSALLPAVPSKG